MISSTHNISAYGGPDEQRARVAEIVYARRHELGLRQKDFEGVSQYAVSSFESGVSMPYLDTFLRLADALGYDVLLAARTEAPDGQAENS